MEQDSNCEERGKVASAGQQKAAPLVLITMISEFMGIIFLVCVLWVTMVSINETVLRAETAKLIQTQRVSLNRLLVQAVEKDAVDRETRISDELFNAKLDLRALQYRSPLLKDSASPKPKWNTPSVDSGQATDAQSFDPLDSVRRIVPQSIQGTLGQVPNLGRGLNAKTSVEERLQQLDGLELALNSITLQGGSKDDTASDILRRVGLLFGENIDKYHNAVLVRDEYWKNPNEALGWRQYVFFAVWLPSEALLAVLLLGSGIIGALIAKFRKTEAARPSDMVSLQPFLLGASAGFICFLVLRGGKSIFLLDSSSQFQHFQHINPYSAAFAALLAGLFTDRSFKVLTTATDALMEKIELVVKSDRAVAERSSQLEPLVKPKVNDQGVE